MPNYSKLIDLQLSCIVKAFKGHWRKYVSCRNWTRHKQGRVIADQINGLPACFAPVMELQYFKPLISILVLTPLIIIPCIQIYD